MPSLMPWELRGRRNGGETLASTARSKYICGVCGDGEAAAQERSDAPTYMPVHTDATRRGIYSNRRQRSPWQRRSGASCGTCGQETTTRCTAGGMSEAMEVCVEPEGRGRGRGLLDAAEPAELRASGYSPEPADRASG